MIKRKILFLGETYRADAITWRKGLEEFGDFDIISWELQTPSNSIVNRMLRLLEFLSAPLEIKRIIKKEQPDIVIAERTTSYGFLAALSGAKCIAIAQQGITDLWPIHSFSYPIKKIIQRYAFKKATLIHAWGKVMTPAMIDAGVAMNKVMILPKGIDLRNFNSNTTFYSTKITAIVTRSLTAEYRHETILKAFAILHKKEIDFELIFIGDGNNLNNLNFLTQELQLTNKVKFLGRVPYTDLPQLLQKANYYISMPNTEGVSASLFEAMACSCYPIVSNIEGNQEWITNNHNGSLIPVDNYTSLAETILTTFENESYRKSAIIFNQNLVNEKANYQTNMMLIAKKYHELIVNSKHQ